MTKFKVEFEIEAESASVIIGSMFGEFSGITKLNIEEAKPDNKYRTFGDVEVKLDPEAIKRAVARGGYVQGGQIPRLGDQENPNPENPRKKRK